MTDITQGEDTEAEVAKRTKIADRDWINDAGEVVKEEEATGVRYKFLGRDDSQKANVPAARRVKHNASGESFTIYFRDLSEAAQRMAMGFGLITRMGNWTNTWLTDTSDERADFPEQVIQAGVELLNSGKWIDRVEGVGAARVNLDKLAEAIYEVLGKGSVAQFRDRLESDEEFKKTARKVPQIREAYLRLVGKPDTTATVEDLSKMLEGV